LRRTSSLAYSLNQKNRWSIFFAKPFSYSFLREGPGAAISSSNLGAAEEKRLQLFDPPKAESFEIAWSEP
jgi:hypothetical protein